MKKNILVGIILGLAVVACGGKTVKEVKNTTSTVVAEAKDKAIKTIENTIFFSGENGEEYSLKINEDNAILKTEKGEEFALKNAVSASGVRFADERGNEIHFKEEIGYIKVNGKEIMANKFLAFKAEDGSEYKLHFNGDNAVLKTAKGEEFTLKNAVSASGTRLADEKGNEIHFKGDSGVATINGKEFPLELKK